MSKFFERLDRINRSTTNIAMGFGVSTKGPAIPSLATIAVLAHDEQSGPEVSNLANIGIDGILIDSNANDASATNPPGGDGIPWGVRTGKLTLETAQIYKDKGCDFICADAAGIHVEALTDEDMGYVLRIQHETDDRTLRGMEDLPIDAIVVPSNSNSPLTLEHLIRLGAIRTMLSGYLLLEVDKPLTAWELKALKDMGIDGIVAQLSLGKELKDLAANVSAIPKRNRTRGVRPSPLLPHGGYLPLQAHAQDDYDDDDDDLHLSTCEEF